LFTWGGGGEGREGSREGRWEDEQLAPATRRKGHGGGGGDVGGGGGGGDGGGAQVDVSEGTHLLSRAKICEKSETRIADLHHVISHLIVVVV